MSRDRLLELVSIAFVGTVVGRGLVYGLNLVVARGFGPEAVGAFAVGTVVMNLGSLISRGGLDDAAKRRIPVHLADSNRQRLTGTVLVGLVFPVVAGIVLAGVAYLLLRGNPGVISVPHRYLVPFLVAIPAVSLMRVGLSISQGFKQTRYMVIVRDLIQPLSALSFVILGVYVAENVLHSFVGYVLSFVFGAAAIVGYLGRQGAFAGLRGPVFELRKVARLAPPLFFASTIRYIVFWADILMLGVLATTAATGRYQIAFQTSVLLTFFLTAVNSMFPSVAATLYHDGQTARLADLYAASTKWVLYLSSFGYVVFFLYGEHVLGLFGPEFVSAEPLLLIVATGQMIAVATGPAGFLLTMTDYERYELANATVVGLTNVLLNFVLIQRYGALGAAVATGISIALLNVLRLLQVRHFLGLLPYRREYVRGAIGLGIVAVVMAVSPVVVPSRTLLAELSLGAVAGTVVYAWFLLSFCRSDRDSVLFEEF
jgi:O-antigen/teichoic acid export membrane protein